MRLNDTVIPHAKPGPKPFKLFDGGGLYLLVNANGSRWSSRKPADRSTFRGTEHDASPFIHG
jgi:hypothetical protein